MPAADAAEREGHQQEADERRQHQEAVRLSGRAILLVLCLAVAFVVARLGWRASRRRLV